MDRVVRWAPAEGIGAEHLSLRSTADGVAAEGVVVGARHGTPYGLHYRVACDPLWRVREAVLSLAGEDRHLHLRSDGEGNWQDSKGHPVEVLQGCAGRLYRYEGLFQGYVGELPVDTDGLVLDYPGTFRRV